MPGGFPRRHSPATLPLFGLYRRRIKRREATNSSLTLVFDPKGGMARIRGLESSRAAVLASEPHGLDRGDWIDEDRKAEGDPVIVFSSSLTGWQFGATGGICWPTRWGGPWRPPTRGIRRSG